MYAEILAVEFQHCGPKSLNPVLGQNALTLYLIKIFKSTSFISVLVLYPNIQVTQTRTEEVISNGVGVHIEDVIYGRPLSL